MMSSTRQKVVTMKRSRSLTFSDEFSPYPLELLGP